MEYIYIILLIFSILAVLIGLIISINYFDKQKNEEGENCEYNPNIGVRPCCGVRVPRNKGQNIKS